MARDSQLAFSMSPKVHAELVEIRDITGVGSLLDVARMAFAVYAFLIRHQKAGGTITLIDSEGREQPFTAK